MNDQDPFEKRLGSQPGRLVPPEWRDEILCAARASAPAAAPVARPEARAGGLSWSARFNARVSALLWPHPAAWGGLAAAWVLVIGLQLADREPVTQVRAQTVVPVSGEIRKLLREQEQLFAELAGPPERPVIDRPKPAVPSPQSRRDENFVNV